MFGLSGRGWKRRESESFSLFEKKKIKIKKEREERPRVRETKSFWPTFCALPIWPKMGRNR